MGLQPMTTDAAAVPSAAAEVVCEESQPADEFASDADTSLDTETNPDHASLVVVGTAMVLGQADSNEPASMSEGSSPTTAKPADLAPATVSTTAPATATAASTAPEAAVESSMPPPLAHRHSDKTVVEKLTQIAQVEFLVFGCLPDNSSQATSLLRRRLPACSRPSWNRRFM